MAGVFRGFRTRAQLGLKPARSAPRNITPGGPDGGISIHYGGPRTGITAATSHDACERRWRGWQDYHMRGNGWSDIAYTGAFCQHGYAFAGRGAGVRTAGQGSNAGNQLSYAIVFIGGSGDVPTQDAIAAMHWWIATLRASKVAPAGPRVWCHYEWHSTDCPGKLIAPHAKACDRKPVHAASATVAAKAAPHVGIPAPLSVDGDLGGRTRGAVEWYVGSVQDGVWDRMDVRRIQTWVGSERTGQLDRMDVRRLQTKVGHERTGQLDTTTVGALQRWLNRRIEEARGKK